MEEPLGDATGAGGGGTLGLRVLTSPVTLTGLTAVDRNVLAKDWSRCVAPTNDPYAELVALDDFGDPHHPGFRAALAGKLTQDAVRRLAGAAVMLHAAGLSHASGAVLALVAPSGGGKSSAARALCREQFGYVTDETLAIDGSGRVIPYPKPLHVDRDARTGRKTQIGPDALGLLHCPDELTLARIVVLDRSREAGTRPSLECLPLSDALIALAPQTSSLAAFDDPLQVLCRLVEVCGGAYRLTYADIEDAGDLLVELLASETEVASDAWEPEPAPSTEAGYALWGLRDGRLRQRPTKDAVRTDDGDVVLLVDDVPVRLSGIGTTLWRAAAAGATTSDLENAAVEAHGQHPQAHELVENAVSELCAANVLASAPPLLAGQILSGCRCTADDGGVEYGRQREVAALS